MVVDFHTMPNRLTNRNFKLGEVPLFTVPILPVETICNRVLHANKSFMQIDVDTKVKRGFSKFIPKHSVVRNRRRRMEKYQIKNSHQFKILIRRHVDFLLSDKGASDVHMLAHHAQYQTPGRVGDFRTDEIVIPTVIYNNFKEEILDEMVVDFHTVGFHAKQLTIREFETFLESPTTLACRKIPVRDSVVSIKLAQEFGVVH